ncbi:hypothetical protein BJX70DRAFT_396123 [Aspergillus crustosus]
MALARPSVLNVRNPTIFPPLSALPSEPSTSSTITTAATTTTTVTPPRRHCFIAQIISVQATYHFDIELRVIDPSGSYTTIGFATPREHDEILDNMHKDCIQPNGCIMVLDAVKSVIWPGGMGIVIKDVRMVKVRLSIIYPPPVVTFWLLKLIRGL